jgi:hypothetical protein
MTISSPILAENCVRTTDSSTIADVLNGATTAICLLPRNCRQGMSISIPQDVPTERFLHIIEKSLEEQMPTNNIWVMSIEQDTDETDQETRYVYSVVYLCVPKQLTDKLRTGGFTNVQFYVGLSENEREYSILDGIPLNSQVATHNREGMSYPYYLDVTI